MAASNTPHEFVLMIEKADIQDLLIIMEQFEAIQHRYEKKDAIHVLKCIQLRRKTLESELKIKKYEH